MAVEPMVKMIVLAMLIQDSGGFINDPAGQNRPIRGEPKGNSANHNRFGGVFGQRGGMTGGFEPHFNIKDNCSVPLCSSDGKLLLTDTLKQMCGITCSCDASCGSRHDCCYDNDDTVKVVKTYQLRCADTVPFKFYVMDKCFADGSNTPFHKDGCNGIDSTVSPVSSAIKHRAYINADCARCNGANDYENFDVRLKCPNFTTFIEVAMGLRSNTVCTKEYIPTLALNIWMKNYICEEEFAPAPGNYRPKDEKLANNCSSLNSPVYKNPDRHLRPGFNKLYKSLFCFSEYAPSAFIVPDPFSYDPLGMRYLVLRRAEEVVHADGDELITYAESFVSVTELEEPCANFTIKNALSNGCRRVYCPETKTRADKSCKNILPLVPYKGIMVQLNLVPGAKAFLPADLLIKTTQSSPMYVHMWLRSPCRIPLSGQSIFMSTADAENGPIVSDLVYQVKYHLYGLNFWDLSFMDDCFTGQWYVSIDGTYYNLTASMDRFKSFVADGRNMTKMTLPDGVMATSDKPNEDVVAKRYQELVDGTSQFGPMDEEGPVDIYLTKLYFCEYIVLYPNEVIILFNSVQMKHNCVILYDNEFAIHSGDETNQLQGAPKFVVKVCVEDYVRETTSTCSGGNGVSMMAKSLLIVVVTLLYVIIN